MRNGAFSVAKGQRGEALAAKMHRDNGLKCQRVPSSGRRAFRGNRHDLDIHTIDGMPIRLEVKLRQNGEGFRTIRQWVKASDADGVFLKEDHQEPIVCVSFSTWVRIMAAAQAGGLK